MSYKNSEFKGWILSTNLNPAALSLQVCSVPSEQQKTEKTTKRRQNLLLST